LEKSLFQLLLLGFNKTFRRVNVLTYAVAYLSLVLTYFLLELRRGRFNYDRFGHWYRMSLLGVLWLGLLASLSHWVSMSSGYWLLTLVLGWTALVVFGLVWMRLHYPSLLYRKQGVDTQQLFKFAFKFSTNLESIRFLAKLNRRYRVSASEQPIHIHLPPDM